MAGPNKKSSGKKTAKHTSKKAAGTKRAATRGSVKAGTKPRPATKSGAATKSRPAKKAAAAPTPNIERVIAESTRQMVAAAAAACEASCLRSHPEGAR